MSRAVSREHKEAGLVEAFESGWEFCITFAVKSDEKKNEAKVYQMNLGVSMLELAEQEVDYLD